MYYICYIYCLFVLFFQIGVFWDCPETLLVDHVGLELRDLPFSAS